MTAIVILSFIFTASLWELSDECLSLTGATPQFASSERQSTFQSLELVLSPGLTFTCTGHVVSWQAYVEQASQDYNLIVFQVWRPLSNCSFELTGSHRVEGYAVGSDYLVDTATINPPLTPLAVAPGDIAGIYVKQKNFASEVGVQQYPNDSTTVYSHPTSADDLSDISTLNFCGDGNSVSDGAPIVNAQVIEDMPTSTTPETPPISTQAGATTTLSETNTPSVTTSSPLTASPSTATEGAGVATTASLITETTSLSASTSAIEGTITSVTEIESRTSGNGATTIESGATTTDGAATGVYASTESNSSTMFSRGVGNGTEGPGDGREGNMDVDEEPSSESSSLYIAGIISGVLVGLVVLGCALCLCCCYAIRRGNKFNLKHLRRHQRESESHDYYETISRHIQLKGFGKGGFEASGAYAVVGPPTVKTAGSISKESNLDFSSTESSRWLHTPMASMEYEVPQASELEKPKRCNTYEEPNFSLQASKPHPLNSMVKRVPRSKGRSQLEVSNAYEIPVDAESWRNNSAIFQESGVYDVPIGAQQNGLEHGLEGVSQQGDGCGLMGGAMLDTAERSGASLIEDNDDEGGYIPMASVRGCVLSAGHTATASTGVTGLAN